MASNRTITIPADPQRLAQGAYTELRTRAEARGHGKRTVAAGVGGIVGGMAGSFKGGWAAALGAAAGALLGAVVGDALDRRESEHRAALAQGGAQPWRELPQGTRGELELVERERAAPPQMVSAPVRRR